MIPNTMSVPPRNTGVEVVHRPNRDELPPLPTRGDVAGHYQRVLLNIRTGELRFFCADWRIPFQHRSQPGDRPNTTVGTATEPVPGVLQWVIDTWTEVDWPADERHPTLPWIYMTRDQGDQFVASLTPLAQHLVSNLFRVPGTGDLEWSAESAAAAQEIWAACQRDQQGPRDGVVSTAGMVNFADAVAAVPDLIRCDWAEMSDTELDQQADAMNRGAAYQFPQLKEQFGVPFSDGSGLDLDLYGSRAWLYAYRAHEADHRPVIDASKWFSRPENTLARRVTPDLDADALAGFADRECLVAAKAGLKLVGIMPVLRSYRDDLRTRIVEEDLPRARAEVDRLKQATAVRARLLGQIIGWGDPRYSDSNAALGRRAGMTGEAVRQLRQALTETD